MTNEPKAALRGFDSYTVSLGDELRGERAVLGKSLLDVQRDLKIKASHIDAIENADPSAIPYPSFVAGYVRSYARYLHLDEEVVLRRFCEEADFDLASVTSAPRRAQPKKALGKREADAAFVGSRLAAASRSASFEAELNVFARAAGSLAAMAAVAGGVWWSASTVLESVQRVGFAPSPQAPQALVAAPRIAQAGVAPSALIDPAALAAVYASQEAPPPPVPSRDGPIGAIDPSTTGIYAPPPPEPADPETAAIAPVVDAPLAAALAALNEPDVETAEPVVETGVVLIAREEAWVRVRDAGGRVRHEGLMPAGSEWRAPDDAQGFTLRAGNAGGVFVKVDGRLYGPLGSNGGVVSNVPLDGESVASAFPEAPDAASDTLNAALIRR